MRAEFVTFFINNANLIKMIAAILIYLIVPIDLLPEYLLGAAGYLDDFGIIILIFLYTVANTAVEYVRRREWLFIGYIRVFLSYIFTSL